MSGPQYGLPAALPVPTQDERSMALMVHILSIFTGFWAALIIYLIKRDSKFISFHALQSLFWHLLYMVISMVFVFGLFFIFFATLITHVVAQHGPGAGPPVAAFMVFPFFWLGVLLLWAVNLLLGIVFAIKANAGEWVMYPVVGRWALRAVGL
jgi:uncharacterized membrane protein